MDIICGIYKITNKLNGKSYIGQSVNIMARWYAHVNSSRRNNAQDSNTVIHTAMRKYGDENFSLSIVEKCEKEKLNEREIYWIQYYDTYKNGYNMTLGGEGNKGETNGRAILAEEDVYDIRMMYDNHVRFKDAFDKYKDKISKRGFQKVWRFENWLYILPEVYTDENKKWHATMAKGNVNGNKELGTNNLDRKCSEEEIALMRKLRQEGKSYSEISKEVNRSIGVIRKYCLFQESSTPMNGSSIKNVETGLIFQSQVEAAKWAGCDRRLISKNKNTDKPAGVVSSTGEPAHWVTQSVSTISVVGE